MQGHYTHHFGPSDCFGQTSLGAPGQAGLCSILDFAHVTDPGREQVRVEAFFHGVHLELVKDVLTTGLWTGGAEIRPLFVADYFKPVFGRKEVGRDRLGEGLMNKARGGQRRDTRTLYMGTGCI